MKFKNLLIKFKRSLLAVALVFLISGLYAQDFSEQKIVQVDVNPYGYHNMALDTLGRIWTWGSNTQGQIGDGTNTSPVTTPYLITMTADSTSLESVVFTKVVAGSANSYAIDENGQLWGWGDNAYQQLAMEGTEDQFGPVKIMEGTQIVDIYAGKNFNYAKDSEGKFWVWGRNSSSGQLGLGTTGTNVVTPVEFSIEGVAIVKIEPSDAHTIALDNNGDIWVWGNRTYSRLGLDVSENQPTPVKLTLTYGDGSPVTFADISTGQHHNLAIDSNGNIWAWGKNSFGQLGNGTTLSSSGGVGELPVQVTSDTTFVSVYAGGNYSFAYDSEGNLYSFGWNLKPNYGYDLIGTDSTDNVVVPTVVDRYNYSNVMTGWVHRLYLDENGNLWGWGHNEYGQVTGTETPVAGPKLLNNHYVPPVQPNFKDQLITQASVSPFGYHNMALDAYGRIWTWGSNNNGQIGNGITDGEPVTTPYLITMTADSTSLEGVVFTKVVAAYANSYAIDENGQLWGWGDNAYQQLAMEGTEDQFGPVKIMDSTQIVDIYAGKNFNYAKDSEGKLWVWGRNSSSGQLGLGTAGTNVVTPVEFSIEGVTIVKIQPADAHAIALDSNGDIWVWGNRTYSRLGLAVSENQPTPVKLELTGGDGNPVKFADISTGQLHNLAVDSTGNIWAWGKNSFGQVGNGSVDTGRDGILPVQVTTDSSFVSVYAGGNYSFAYDSEGNLYSFGWNTKPNYGYDLIGTDSTDNVLVPTMVDHYNYSNVITGWLHRLYLDENGGLWGWGNNAFGQLTGTKTPYVAPILLNGYATLSNDSTLASLTVTPGTLSPEFNSAVAEYMVQVPTGTASFDITATVSDPGAFVTGTGTIELVSADTTVSVVVMAEDGSTMTYHVNVTVAVGVKDQVYNKARVYPNPTTGILNVEGQQVKAIEVYNLSGSKMRVEMNSNNRIDVSELVYGTYILRITNTDDQISVVKFVKVNGTR